MQWIKEFRIKEKTLCDHLIKGFKKAREMGFTFEGTSAKGVDKTWKDSEDAGMNCLPIGVYKTHVRAYREHVMAGLETYLEDFPILTTSAGRLGFLEPPQIQYYKPGAAFFGEHFESSGLNICHRVLAFMTYLNDIEEGGGTHFVYQNYTCEPKKGKTVIWPAGFTHTHHGVPAPDEEKYIITGWLSYMGV